MERNSYKFIIIYFALMIGIFSQETELSLPFPDDLKSEMKEEITKKNETSTDDFQKEIQKLDESKKAEFKIQEKKESEPGSTLQKAETEKESNLPNLISQDSKKARKQSTKTKNTQLDESKPPYERGTIQLQRTMPEKARMEFKESSQIEKNYSFKSKLEEIRLLGLENKIDEAKNLAINLENPNEKFQALFELSRSLDHASSKTKEDSISIYMIIITEAPKSEKIRLRTLWALSHILFRTLDYKGSLHFLSEILQNYKESEFFDNAIYLCGKIYEMPWPGKDLEKANRFFTYFLKNESEENFRNSEYLNEVKKRAQNIF